MKTNFTTHALPVLVWLALAGCSKSTPEPLPTPLPAPTATYSRTIAYLDQGQPMRRDTAYAAELLLPTAEQNAHYLTVRLKSKANYETVSFRVARASVAAAGFVGTYPLKTPLTANPGEAEFDYVVDIPGATGNGIYLYTYGSWLYAPTGAFTITAYDANRQLLSGSFTATVGRVNDPLALDNALSIRRCNLTLRGTFANIVVKTSE
jgi:hypothetical protein